MSRNKAELFNARVGMIASYADDYGLVVGDDVVHVLAFPNHPDFYKYSDISRYFGLAEKWGRNVRFVVRDEMVDGPDLIRWSAVERYSDLRAFLDCSPQFKDIDSFVIHSMSNPLAPLRFFEVAPIAMTLFDSESVISGVKLESSLYWTTAGGVLRQENSRTLFEDNRVVLHSGGLTGFRRGSQREAISTLLEISDDMTTEGHTL